MYQTCDLANLGRNGVMEELAAKMPQLISLRDAIYSPEFKSFVQEVTGCGELSDQVPYPSSASVGFTDCSHQDLENVPHTPRQINFRSPHFEKTRSAEAESGVPQAACTAASSAPALAAGFMQGDGALHHLSAQIRPSPVQAWRNRRPQAGSQPARQPGS